MILRIVYFVLSAVIIYQVFSLLKLSDKLEESKKNVDYWFNEYLKERKENEENKKILQNIKDSMTF